MREIVTRKYVANDGTEFLTLADCLEYEEHKYALEKDKAENDLLKIPHIYTNSIDFGFNYSSDEDKVIILILKDENDLQVLNKFVSSFSDSCGDIGGDSIGKVLAIRYDRIVDYCEVYDLLKHGEALLDTIHRYADRIYKENLLK